MFDFVQAALTPNSDVVLKASIWMREYFNHYCSQPHLGEKEIHLESGTEKIDVWNEYVAAIKFQYKDNEHLDYGKFVNLWNTIFPHVKIPDHKACSAKCWTCHEIRQCAINAEDKVVYDAAKELHQMHRRGLYMRERIFYKKTCADACSEENTLKVMLLMIIMRIQLQYYIII